MSLPSTHACDTLAYLEDTKPLTPKPYLEVLEEC